MDSSSVVRMSPQKSNLNQGGIFSVFDNDTNYYRRTSRIIMLQHAELLVVGNAHTRRMIFSLID